MQSSYYWIWLSQSGRKASQSSNSSCKSKEFKNNSISFMQHNSQDQEDNLQLLKEMSTASRECSWFQSEQHKWVVKK